MGQPCRYGTNVHWHWHWHWHCSRCRKCLLSDDVTKYVSLINLAVARGGEPDDYTGEYEDSIICSGCVIEQERQLLDAAEPGRRTSR